MKKSLLVFSLLYFFAFYVKAQPSIMTNIFYAYYVAPSDSNYRLSYGLTTHIKTGYLSIGYTNAIMTQTTSFFGSRNFQITGYGNSFIWKGYEIFDANSCNGTLTKVNNCKGVTAVEVKGLNNIRYVLAGSYDKAAFFTSLDSVGGVINYMQYPFPPPTNTASPYPSKPIIIKSNVQHEYFICGTYENSMYILNVNSTGNIIWSSYYNGSNGIQPKAIMIDPYHSNRLIVAGGMVTETMDKDAFFMSVDALTGLSLNVKLFGNPGGEDIFNSVIEGSNMGANNGQGYVLGGYSQGYPGSTQGTAWLVKLDPNGTIIWNRLITPSLGTNKGIVDVIERLNTLNAYEYYALTDCSIGMQVAKLDDAGLPFQFFNPSGPNNEYVYNYTGNVCRSNNLGYVNTTSPGNFTGIQVYGTQIGYLTFPWVNGSAVISAYFNGETNCFYNYSKLSYFIEGPGFMGESNVTKFGALSSCSNFLITDAFAGIIAAYHCGGVIPSGSNQRTAPNGEPLALIEKEEKLVSVYPNPVINKTTVTYNSHDQSRVIINLFDVSGRLISSIQPDLKSEGTYNEEIDFTNLDLSSGVYFLTISVDGTVTKEKIVYNK